ncbi:MAG: SDR family NAD(P)-dependent oxidoreductase [Candidatus Dormibacteraeota bacterium]|nr:SDR family NAD(P)-dependent oxidoreductase [Candidatus Dormibacteraeota bacterium]
MAAKAERVALVTGANSGIGLATVIELARRGFRSVGTVRSPAKARAVHAAAREADVDVETVILDVADLRRCERVIDDVRPFALVNNAGISNLGAVEDVSDAEARMQVEIMLLAPIRLARLAIPHMREAGEGRVVNISSIYGLMTTPLAGWYQACKHGLEAVSDALRMEVARDGVRVSLVEPGGFDTAIWEQGADAVARRGDSRYARPYERTLQGVQFARPAMGKPEGVARVVASAILSSRPRSRYVVGYDAHAARLYSRVMPERVRDRLARMTLGL